VVHEFYEHDDADAEPGSETSTGAPDGPAAPAQPLKADEPAIVDSADEGCASSPEPSTEFDEEKAAITGGQFALLKAKCEHRALKLGLGEEDWHTIFGHVLKDMGVQSAADLTMPDGLNEAIAKISAYELPGGV